MGEAKTTEYYGGGLHEGIHFRRGWMAREDVMEGVPRARAVIVKWGKRVGSETLA